MVLVLNVVEKLPFAPIAVTAVAVFIVIDTCSPTRGNTAPAAIRPERPIEGVPDMIS
jgi:hypothetical protein